MAEERAVCQVVCIHEDAVGRARAALIAGQAAEQLAETFKALSDPSRLRIISALSSEELCVCDIAAVVGMTQSAVSHQLRLLRTLRLVKYRREGQIVFYSLDDQHIAGLFADGLAHLAE